MDMGSELKDFHFTNDEEYLQARSPTAGKGAVQKAVAILEPKSIPSPAKLDQERGACLVADTLEGWMQPEHLEYNGLLVKRPFGGQWDDFQGSIDELFARFGNHDLPKKFTGSVRNGKPEDLERWLWSCISGILSEAALPAQLSKQIEDDACAIGKVVGALCPFAPEVTLKLEIFADNICRRWHQDNYVGRAIVSYTGHTGTEYTRHSNVDFEKLYSGADNQQLVRDANKIESVDVGDILFMKGKLYPHGAKGLVHKSPKERYHQDGRILNRLVLKVDVQ